MRYFLSLLRRDLASRLFLWNRPKDILIFRDILRIRATQIMWLTRFLDITSRLVPSDPLAGIGQELTRLNPDKIYVENVRSLLGISHRSALGICETAVRQGLFTRGVEVLCPDGSVAVSASREEDLPPTVKCWSQEEGHYQETVLPTKTLQKITFYRLDDERAAVLHQ